MSDFQLMTLEDRIILRDEKIQKGQNFMIIRDPETNAVLQVRKNLVVRSGREYDLRKIFSIPYTSETQGNLNDRSLCLFGIGTGGTPISDPFNPIAPTSADTELNNPVSFRTSNTLNPLSSGDQLLLTDGRTVGSDTLWYKKTFTNKALTIDPTLDQAYVLLTLDITSADARNQLISELGLYTSRVPTANSYLDYKLFSRITFQTEPLNANTNKGLSISYYVYA